MCMLLLKMQLTQSKTDTAKATCFCRSILSVVEPHSRSVVPLAISGIRVAEVTGFITTLSVDKPRCFVIAVTTFIHKSIE